MRPFSLFDQQNFPGLVNDQDIAHGMAGLGQSYQPKVHPAYKMNFKPQQSIQEESLPPQSIQSLGSNSSNNFNVNDIVKAYGQGMAPTWAQALQAFITPLATGTIHGIANRYGQGGFGQGMIEGGEKGYEESQKQYLQDLEKQSSFRERMLENPEMVQAYAMAKREKPDREPRTSDLYRKLSEIYEAKQYPGLAGIYIRQSGGNVDEGLSKYIQDQLALRSLPQASVVSHDPTLTPLQEFGYGLLGIRPQPSVTRTYSVKGQPPGMKRPSGGTPAKLEADNFWGR